MNKSNDNHNYSVKNTLAEQAEGLIPICSIDDLVQYPGENGPRLACFPRSDIEEMRLNLSTYKDHLYLQYSTWRKGDDGKWKPDKTQSIRLSELDLFAVVIQKVTELVSEQTPDQDRE